MPRAKSAGLLMVRVGSPARFLLVHPGGPYFRKRDDHVWSIPKGLPEEGEAWLPLPLGEGWGEGYSPKNADTRSTNFFLPANVKLCASPG